MGAGAGDHRDPAADPQPPEPLADGTRDDDNDRTPHASGSGQEKQAPPLLMMGGQPFLAQCTRMRDRDVILSHEHHSKPPAAVYWSALDESWAISSNCKDWCTAVCTCFNSPFNHSDRDPRAQGTFTDGAFSDFICSCSKNSCQEKLECPLSTACNDQRVYNRMMVAAYTFLSRRTRAKAPSCSFTSQPWCPRTHARCWGYPASMT